MFIRLKRQNSPTAPAIPTLIHHTQVPKDIAKDLPLTPSRVTPLSPAPFSPGNVGCPRQVLAGSLSCTCSLPPHTLADLKQPLL